MREAADGLLYGRVSPRYHVSGHLLTHSNSFSFEMEKDAAGCRAFNRNFIVGGIIMICVGIDTAKDKHDCCILSSDGEILADVFTIPNNAEGFDTLLQAIRRCASPEDKIKVGLEAAGHYSCNILGFLLDKGLHTYVINPLHTNLYRKSLSLRKTKTDRVDARTIAAMLIQFCSLFWQPPVSCFR